jgi:hypothetical protein
MSNKRLLLIAGYTALVFVSFYLGWLIKELIA